MHTMTKQANDKGACARFCAHDIIKNHRRRNRTLQKGIPGNPVRGTTGHNIPYTCNDIV